MNLTLDDLQGIIHKIYEGNTSTPSSTEEDYLLRLGYINDAIRIWEGQSVDWRELFTNLSDASDGDKTTSSGVTAYSAPTDFVKISSYVKVGSYYYPYIEPNQVLTTLRNDSTKKFFYITGSPGSYVININPTPDPDLTISYSYYKTATTLSSGTDKPEMRLPMFIVYHTLARLYEGDLRNDMVSLYEQKAKEVMDEMIILNEVPPFNRKYQIDDISYTVDGIAFGK